jgi:DNA-binding NarL/FixJ family response regulator
MEAIVEQEILLVGSETPALHYALPFLRRAQFRITQVAQSAHALPLVRDSRFDLVIARHPLAGLDLSELVRTVRADEAACRNASFLVLAEPGAADEVAALMGRGVNRVVSLDAHTERLLEAIADLLDVAPRRTLRALVRLESEVRQGAQTWRTATHNVSETGMLLLGLKDLEIGTRVGFELELPAGQSPVAGEAEVVRHTNPEFEKVEGVGARILTFSGDGRRQLRIFLDNTESAKS